MDTSPNSSSGSSSESTSQKSQGCLAVFLVVLAFVLFVSCAGAFFGKEDGVERVSSSAGFKCEVCAGYGLKRAATYHVVKNHRDYYVCAGHLSVVE